MNRWIAYAFVAAMLTATPPPAAQAGEYRVLFIGNSLTSAYDVPNLVEQLTAHGTPRVRSTIVARNNFSLEDHWNDGEARTVIERGTWSFVVLQQGPSALPESRVQLRASVKQFASVIRKAGARPALYMVWPSLARRNDFDRVRESYALAASDVNGLFIPAGEAWRGTLARDPAIRLYGEDGFHPTPHASYLAALVIAGALTGRDPLSLTTRPTGWPTTLLTDELARTLQQSAAEALRASARF